ncbi:MAG: site-2 protease family protein [Acidobacteriota bacterium]|nr:site-2 protease family protein [Acidobacteriota bacterium]
MNPDQLAFGFLQYVVFLFSTTCHEASHALAAKWGGDTTALEGGQVSLNPLPHIKREPFGMVIVPLMGVAFSSGVIGWASAPYDPLWSQRHPRRAAWMSLAGPAANFSLAVMAGILMRIGLPVGFFVPLYPSPSHIVGAVNQAGAADGIATVLSIFFTLNVVLGCFNLIPFPPFDGYSVLGLFTTDAVALKLQAFRLRLGVFGILGLVIAWQFFNYVYPTLFYVAMRAFYAGYRFS